MLPQLQTSSNRGLAKSCEPEREDICQEGSLVGNWAAFHKRSVAAAVHRGARGRGISEESHRLSCQPPALVPVVSAGPLQSSWHPVSTNELRPAPSHPRHGHGLICIHTDQSEQLHNDQEGVKSITTVLFGPIILCQFGFLICIKMDQSPTRAGTCSMSGDLPFVFPAGTSGFCQRLHFSG